MAYIPETLEAAEDHCRFLPDDQRINCQNTYLAGYDYRQKEIDELVEALDKMNRFYKHLNPDLKNGANIQLWHNEIKPEVEELIQKHKR